MTQHWLHRGGDSDYEVLVNLEVNRGISSLLHLYGQTICFRCVSGDASLFPAISKSQPTGSPGRRPNIPQGEVSDERHEWSYENDVGAVIGVAVNFLDQIGAQKFCTATHCMTYDSGKCLYFEVNHFMGFIPGSRI
jgi:hypothetical protein